MTNNTQNLVWFVGTIIASWFVLKGKLSDNSTKATDKVLDVLTKQVSDLTIEVQSLRQENSELKSELAELTAFLKANNLSLPK